MSSVLLLFHLPNSNSGKCARIVTLVVTLRSCSVLHYSLQVGALRWMDFPFNKMSKAGMPNSLQLLTLHAALLSSQSIFDVRPQLS
jgi:hypothetical protein